MGLEVIDPIHKVVTMLQAHLKNILTYCGYRVTNAVPKD
jgi:hypothetical protein